MSSSSYDRASEGDSLSSVHANLPTAISTMGNKCKWFSFPPTKNGLSYGDRPHRHHRAAPAPTRWQKREQLSKHPSHLDCLCLQRSWSRKLVAAKSRAAFVSPLCLTHSCPLSRSNGQSSFTRATTLSPSIPPASRALLSNIYNED